MTVSSAEIIDAWVSRVKILDNERMRYTTWELVCAAKAIKYLMSVVPGLTSDADLEIITKEIARILEGGKA